LALRSSARRNKVIGDSLGASEPDFLPIRSEKRIFQVQIYEIISDHKRGPFRLPAHHQFDRSSSLDAIVAAARTRSIAQQAQRSEILEGRNHTELIGVCWRAEKLVNRGAKKGTMMPAYVRRSAANAALSRAPAGSGNRDGLT
jgi:hypothetical protein